MSVKRKNEKYLNQKSDTSARNNCNEPPLVNTTFYCELSCDKNREGHWDGKYVAIQLEDCADFFFTLFSYDSYRLVFELAHSKSHKRFAGNARIVDHFNLKPGGSASFVRDVTVTCDSLGP